MTALTYWTKYVLADRARAAAEPITRIRDELRAALGREPTPEEFAARYAEREGWAVGDP
jgi:hypothetical protein